MNIRERARAVGVSAAPAIAALSILVGAGGVSATTTVASGFDLLMTTGASLKDPNSDNFIEFEAYPVFIGKEICGGNAQFNFGTGCLPVNPTDTIVRRLEEANAPTETIDIEMVALSLVSTDPVMLPTGASTHLYARILKDLSTDTWIHGMDLGSTMTIDFDTATYTSDMHLLIDIFDDQWNFLFDVEKLFELRPGHPWSHLPPDLAILYPDINWILNGQNGDHDFFPKPGSYHVAPDGSIHVVDIAVAPIPASAVFVLSAIAGLFGLRFSRRRPGA